MTSTFIRRAGSLFCEDVNLSSLLQLETPFFVYSAAQIRHNYRAYKAALEGVTRSLIGYAVKANHNQTVLRLFESLGAGAIVASETELVHTLACGFSADKMLLHGNGKRPRDIEAALCNDVLISIDSLFDLRHVGQMAKALGKPQVRVLLRINPDIDPQVHPYISTGMHDAKFGMPEDCLEPLLAELPTYPALRVAGLHCHIGSALTSAAPFRDAARIAMRLTKTLREKGHPVDTLDLGGGLGIDYSRGKDPEKRPPDPTVFLAPIVRELRLSGLLGKEGSELTILLEPGRSLIGNAGALVCKVIGHKRGPRKNFLVVDASMAQLIRPSLYGAVHQIEPLCDPAPDKSQGTEELWDIVGPLCESSDFLGIDRHLQAPNEGSGMIIHDAGAYGFSMASRYNLHLLPAEYLIEGSSVRRIRRQETYEDFRRTLVDEEVTFEP